MTGVILRTALRRTRPSVSHVSCFHNIHAGTVKNLYRSTLHRPIDALTTESLVVPSISVRSFGLTSSLSVIDALFDYGIQKGAEYARMKVEETFRSQVGIRVLPSKPHHAYQEKETEIQEIQARFEQLKKDNVQSPIVVGVYIKGGPASGKTQVAREFGELYFEQLIGQRNIGGVSGNKAVVATLDARTPASLLRSYLRLAENLNLPVGRYSVPGCIRDRVLLISIDVQKTLVETAPNWLLIVDGIDPGCKLIKR